MSLFLYFTTVIIALLITFFILKNSLVGRRVLRKFFKFPSSAPSSTQHGLSRACVNVIQHVAKNPLRPKVIDISGRDNCTTIVELLEYHKEHSSEHVPIVYVDDNGQDERLTFSELYTSAVNVAVFITTTANLKQGDRVLLAYTSGLDFVVTLLGCVLSGVIAVPVPPPNPQQLQKGFDHTANIAHDCGASVGFMPSSMLRYYTFRTFIGGPASRKAVKWMTPPSPSHHKSVKQFNAAKTLPDDPVALQYTSGSTASPKGVIITSATLLCNVRLMCSHTGTSANSLFVCWVPVFHDMGLIAGVFHALFVPSTLVLFSPVKFLAEPVFWLAVITAYRATHTAAPNFAYEILFKKVNDAEMRQLDLSTLVSAVNGAEPVRYSTMQKFTEKFSACGFKSCMWYPHYGMAEHMVYLCAKGKDNLQKESSVFFVDEDEIEHRGVAVKREANHPNSKPIIGHGVCPVELQIVHPETFKCLPNFTVGEIWISSPCTSVGYYRREQQSKETFYATISGDTSRTFLRTGDYGFIADGGELFITGRLKDMIIIGGRNIYPQDIELSTEQSHKLIRPGCCAAFGVEHNEHEVVVVVAEVLPEKISDKLGEEITSTVTQKIFEMHSVSVFSVVLIPPRTLLKTTSGKIQRNATKEAFKTSKLRFLYKNSFLLGNSSATKHMPERHPHNVDRDSSVTSVGAVEVVRWLQSQIADLLQVPLEAVDPNMPFSQIGLTSAQIVAISAKLREWLGSDISVTAAYDHPTISLFAKHITSGNDSASSLQFVHPQAGSGAIAIVGIGCRFPKCRGKDQFWSLLCSKCDAVCSMSPTRSKVLEHFPKEMCYCMKQGGFLDDVCSFDNAFFGISASEADAMDPQQRIMLETTVEALEDAGIPIDSPMLHGSGMFIGISFSEYGQMQLSNKKPSVYATTGSSLAITANRISYLFNMHGPSVAIDTACSSSLVAVSQACVAIREGNCDMALAGGVNLLLSPVVTTALENSGFLSPDFRCKSFDATANGYVRGEGCGVVVLKSLERAISDDDNIYSVLLGHCINHCGQTNGLTAPSGIAQEACIKEAISRAFIDASDIDFVEAHGTGTTLGDPIEVLALENALQSTSHSPRGKCRIGSVKTNIGHLESAAGIAGLIKASLSLYYSMLPASLHFKTPNPHIPFNKISLQVQVDTEVIPRRTDTDSSFAGVSSFGFGGTNCHVILQAPPKQSKPNHTSTSKYSLLAITAKSPESVRNLAEQYLKSAMEPSFKFHETCVSAFSRRAHMDYRTVIISRDAISMVEQLKYFLAGKGSPYIVEGHVNPMAKVAFVFSGQGVQLYGFGKELLEYSTVFAENMAKFDTIVNRIAGWSPLTLLNSGDSVMLSQTQYAQPLLFCIQVCLTEALRSLGVPAPAVVLGHSTGEIAAACVSGCLSWEDAVNLVVQRSLVMQLASRKNGKMAHIGQNATNVANFIEATGLASRVCVAADNSAMSCVISGDADAVLGAEEKLKQDVFSCKVLPVEYAYHSHHMEELQPVLLDKLQKMHLTPQEPSIPWISSVTASSMSAVNASSTYWSTQIRHRVEFRKALLRTSEQYGCQVFVEIGPNPILTGYIRETIQDSVCISAQNRSLSEMESLYCATAALFSCGISVSPPEFQVHLPYTHIPSYPFTKTLHWHEFVPVPHTVPNPCCGTISGTNTCKISFSTEPLAFVSQHCFEEMTLVPGVFYLETALACASSLLPDVSNPVVKNISFNKGLFFSSHEPRTMFVEISKEQGTTSVSFYSSSQASETARTLHCVGEIDNISPAIPFVEKLDDIYRRCSVTSIQGQTLRSKISLGGLSLGPYFSGITELKIGNLEALSLVDVPADIRVDEILQYNFHPAVLDACIQGLGVIARYSRSNLSSGSIFLPSKVGTFSLVRRYTGDPLFSHARLVRSFENTISGSVLICSRSTGEPVAFLTDMEWQLMPSQETPESWMYCLNWEEVKELQKPLTEGSLLILNDRKGVAEKVSKEFLAMGLHTRTCISPILQDEVAPKIAEVSSLLGSMPKPVIGILYFWGLDEGSDTFDSMNLLRGLFLLIKTISGTGISLVIVTQGISKLQEDTHYVSLYQNLLIGFCRTAVSEVQHRDLKITCLDLPTDFHLPDVTSALSYCLLSAQHGHEITFRGTKFFTKRLGRVSQTDKKRSIILKATYIVTGGLGGLGLEVVRWLIKHGAHKIVVVSRRAPTDSVATILQQMKTTEIDVACEVGDISDHTFVHQLISKYSTELKGIFHAAGVLHDGLIRDVSWDSFHEVLRPKVLGSWNLHDSCVQLKCDLDFFVMFSSLASVLGNVGQASYSAANAFMDQLALFRKCYDMPATTINWGPISESGMFARLGLAAIEISESRGILPLTIQDFHTMLDNTISSDSCEIIVARIRWNVFTETCPIAVNLMVNKSRSAKSNKTPEQVRDFLVDAIASHSKHTRSEIDIYVPFQEFSFDSMAVINISNRLSEWLGVRVNPISLFDYPTIEQLSQYLGAGKTEQTSEVSSVTMQGAEVDIALVGMACRYPKSPSPESFWNLLCRGECAASETPIERWDNSKFYSANQSEPGKLFCKYGCYVDDIAMFDRKFFGISGREALHMDPQVPTLKYGMLTLFQQRMLLECTWEALEDAGIIPATISNTKTAVYVGIGTNDYAFKSNNNYKMIDGYGGPGNALSISANRLSYYFGIKGPSVAVDTACSSSLIALDAACQAIRTGRAVMAIVGGVNALINPAISITFSKAGMLSNDGRCKTFDATADGYVRGEGCGVVILQDLKTAQASGHQVYALVKGSAVNHSGRSNGMTAPSGPAQEACLREAYRQAGIKPEAIYYIEAHGTGTNLGDPIEAQAIGNVIGQSKASGDFCLVGSVKTNIGHLECGSGIAGIIKAALCLTHRTIPPSINFHTPNPNIDFQKSKLKVVTETTTITSPTPAFVGVSSYGFGGANCHVCLQEYVMSDERATNNQEFYFLPLSAKSKKSLIQFSSLYCSHIERFSSRLSDICFTASLKRTHHAKRLVVIGTTASELEQELKKIPDEQDSSVIRGKMYKNAKIAFVFSGQGGQWPCMLQELLSSNIGNFSRTFSSLDVKIAKLTGWSIMELLAKNPESLETDITQTEYAQPILFCFQVALAETMKQLGCPTPTAVIGHSTGEIAAAYCCGSLTLDNAIALVVTRSKLMQTATGKGGKMAHVELPSSKLCSFIQQCGLSASVSIAADNSPSSCVISGNTESVELLLQRLGDSVVKKKLPVEYAYHSHHMESLKIQLENLLNKASFSSSAPEILWISSVTAKEMTVTDANATYWANQMRESVNFRSAITAATEKGCNVFLEIGLHPILTRYIREISPDVAVIPTGKRNVHDPLLALRTISSLYVVGCPIKLEKVVANDGKFLPPPRYPFNRVRCWADDSVVEAIGSSGVPSKFTSLGDKVSSSFSTLWKTQISLNTMPFLVDHSITGETVLPGTLFVELAYEAATELFSSCAFLTAFELFQPVPISRDSDVSLQITATPLKPKKISIVIYSRIGSSREWSMVSKCFAFSLEPSCTLKNNVDVLHSTLEACQNWKFVDQSRFYSQLKKYGLCYGPQFQGVSKVYCQGGEVLAKIIVPQNLLVSPFLCGHPAILDMCCQAFAASMLHSAKSRSTYLPASYEKVRFSSDIPTLSPGLELVVHATNIRIELNQISGDFYLYCGNSCLVAVEGFTSKKVPQAKVKAQQCYETIWRKYESPSSSSVSMGMVVIGTGAFSTFAKATFQDSVILPYATVELRTLTEAVKSLESKNLIHVIDCRFNDGLQQDQNPSIQADINAKAMLHLAQAISSISGNKPLIRLWVLAQQTENSNSSILLSQSVLRGMVAVITQECPDLRPTILDFRKGSEDAALKEISTLGYEGTQDLSIRSDGIFSLAVASTSMPVKCVRTRSWPGMHYRLGIDTVGDLNSLKLCVDTSPRLSLTADEIEISVAYSALNFRDVMMALGIYPSEDITAVMGGECSGTVTKVGTNVSKFAVGDEVATMFLGCFSSHLTVPDRLVVKKPNNLSLREAASVLSVFATAHYALIDIARITRGEVVLIHAGAGGVGLAAIQVAQKVGAVVIATASSSEKKAFLHDCGVEWVFDSRSSSFSDDIKQLTKNNPAGPGVDIVLNSLAGDLLEQSLLLLRPCGRFLEIGKRDVFENTPIGMRTLSANCSFNVIAIDSLFATRPMIGLKLLSDVIEEFEHGNYKAIKVTEFRADEAPTAFRYMAQAKHIGKIVLNFSAPDLVIETNFGEFRNQSILITGGTGAIGLGLTGWLASKGATSFLLATIIPPSKEVLAQIDSLQQLYSVVISVQIGDVAEPEFVRRLFSLLGSNEPIVFHCAGLISDAVISKQTEETISTVLQPKVRGAWNIHLESLTKPIKSLVLFSSISAITGTVGQVNYAAANSFLDCLSVYRLSLGMPTISLALGPVLGTGMFSRLGSDAEIQAEAQGIIPIRLGDVFQAVDAILHTPNCPPYLCVATFSWPDFFASYPHLKTHSRWVSIAEQCANSKSANNSSQFLQEYTSLDNKSRAGLLLSMIKAGIIDVLHVSSKQLDTEATLAQLGVDSLIAAELKGRLEAKIGSPVPMTVFLQGWSITSMSQSLGKHLDSLASEVQHPVGTPQQSSNLISVLRHSSSTVSGIPVFLVCGAGAPPGSFEYLGSVLPPDRPVYVLYDPSITSGSYSAFSTLEAWADECVTAITQKQEHGPYCLAGMSLGGALAACIYSKLCNRGDSTQNQQGKLLLIDTPPYTLACGQTELMVHQMVLAVTAANLVAHLQHEDGIVALEALGQAISETKDKEEAWKAFETHTGLQRSKTEMYYTAIKRYVLLLDAWSGLPKNALTNAHVTLVIGSGNHESVVRVLSLDKSESCWRDQISNLVVKETRASHFTVLRPPFAEEIAQLLC